MAWSRTCYFRKRITRRLGRQIRLSYRALHLHGQHLAGKATAPSLEVYDSSQIMTTTELCLFFDSTPGQTPRGLPHTALDSRNPLCDMSIQYPTSVNMTRFCLLDMPHELFHQICKEVFGGD